MKKRMKSVQKSEGNAPCPKHTHDEHTYKHTPPSTQPITQNLITHTQQRNDTNKIATRKQRLIKQSCPRFEHTHWLIISLSTHHQSNPSYLLITFFNNYVIFKMQKDE